MSKVNKESANILEENISKLKEFFPEVVSEGKINFDKLKSTLGDFVDLNDEKYTFSWAGRSEAIKNLQTPSKGTLIPEKDESVNFDETENLFLEGDNLEIIKLLQKSFSEKIDLIYIDPPYNTGSDFIYNDDFKNSLDSYLEQTGQTQNKIKLTSNPETSGRFHSDWLSFIYPRLLLSRQLLKNDGIIFISIDDNEVTNLRNVMNEIFGEENFICTIIWQKVYSPKNQSKRISNDHDYILAYSKNIDLTDFALLPRTEKMDKAYKNPDNDPRGRWKPGDLIANGERKSGHYVVEGPNGDKFDAPLGKHWAFSQDKMKELINDNRVWFGKNGNAIPSLKQFLDEVQQGRKASTIFLHSEVGHSDEAKKEIKSIFGSDENLFSTPKPTRLIKQLLRLSKNPNITVLDFFAGSGTTAQAVLEKNIEDDENNKFICIQLPEIIDSVNSKFSNVAEICKFRIQSSIKNLQEKTNNKIPSSKLGFKVFKLAKSNYKIWEDVKDEEKLKDQLKLFEDPLVENYKDIDVIYEIIIKEGYSLNSKIEIFKEKPNKIYKVSDGEFFFYMTLDNTLDETVTQSLNLTENTMFVCLDSALDNSQKINLDKICKLKVI